MGWAEARAEPPVAPHLGRLAWRQIGKAPEFCKCRSRAADSGLLPRRLHTQCSLETHPCPGPRRRRCPVHAGLGCTAGTLQAGRTVANLGMQSGAAQSCCLLQRPSQCSRGRLSLPKTLRDSGLQLSPLQLLALHVLLGDFYFDRVSNRVASVAPCLVSLSSCPRLGATPGGEVLTPREALGGGPLEARGS